MLFHLSDPFSLLCPYPSLGGTQLETTDEDLIKGIAKRDEAALARLYDRYSRAVFGLAMRHTGEVQMAEEVVQDVFLKIWNSATLFDAARGRFPAWLFTVARNVTRDRVRARVVLGLGGLQDLGDVERLPYDDPSIDLLLSRETMLRAMETLSPDQKQVVNLVYFEGMTARDVSQKRGIPLGTVKSRLRLALSHLRRHLLTQGGEVQ